MVAHVAEYCSLHVFVGFPNELEVSGQAGHPSRPHYTPAAPPHRILTIHNHPENLRPPAGIKHLRQQLPDIEGERG